MNLGAIIGLYTLTVFGLMACTGRNMETKYNAKPYRDPNCPKLHSGPLSHRGDFIHDEKTTMTIGRLIIQGFETPDQKSELADPLVDDLGRTWLVQERFKNKWRYGGGLTFQIDKCSGEIEHVIWAVD